MNRTELEYLLKKNFQDTLSAEETQKLHQLINESDIQVLNKQLNACWESYTNPRKPLNKTYKNILSNIDQNISVKQNTGTLYLITRVAAAILLPAFLLVSGYLYHTQKTISGLAHLQQEIVINKGERASLSLADGTTVYLNSSSRLSYSNLFSLKDRTVYLSGEGYFEVTRDEKKPFIVYTEEIQIKVLGTSFNVYCDTDTKDIEISLAEGLVEITPTKKPSGVVLLYPFQKASYNKSTGEISIAETDLHFETAWRRGDLIFRSQKPEEIFKKLESFYGVTIHTENTLPQNTFTGNFHENEILQILLNLQQHYSFSFRKQGQDIYVTFK